MEIHVCGACGHEAAGYSKEELKKDGWCWHEAGDGRHFVVCDECEAYFAERRVSAAA